MSNVVFLNLQLAKDYKATILKMVWHSLMEWKVPRNTLEYIRIHCLIKAALQNQWWKEVLFHKWLLRQLAIWWKIGLYFSPHTNKSNSRRIKELNVKTKRNHKISINDKQTFMPHTKKNFLNIKVMEKTQMTKKNRFDSINFFKKLYTLKIL